jgi:hypothetical protein
MSPNSETDGRTKQLATPLWQDRITGSGLDSSGTIDCSVWNNQSYWEMSEEKHYIGDTIKIEEWPDTGAT